jgi:hypothetical protein
MTYQILEKYTPGIPGGPDGIAGIVTLAAGVAAAGATTVVLAVIALPIFWLNGSLYALRVCVNRPFSKLLSTSNTA